MGMKKLLIYATHGTYGRDDDAYGAMLAANAALAKGLDVILVLVEDGVAMAKAGHSRGAPGGAGHRKRRAHRRMRVHTAGRRGRPGG